MFLLAAQVEADAQNLFYDRFYWAPVDETPAISIDTVNNRLFISSGGKVAPYAMYGCVLDTSNAKVVQRKAYPNAQVKAIVDDGFGGWYIGGEFTRVGDSIRNGIAQIDSNGNLTSFRISFSSSSSVNYLFRHDTILYILGSFSQVNGITKNSIASFNLRANKVTNWNAKLDFNTPDILVANNEFVIYPSYNIFSQNYDLKKQSLIDSSSTTIKSNLANVRAMILRDSILYVGTDFGGASNTLFAINVYNPGANIKFNATVDNGITAMGINDTALYVGGNFFTVNNTSRKLLASFNLSSGTLNNWNPTTSGNSYRSPDCISATNDVIYVSGRELKQFGSKEYIVAIKANGDVKSQWNEKLVLGTSSTARLKTAASKSKLFIGGDIIAVNYIDFRGVYSIDLTTGDTTNFRVPTDGVVSQLEYNYFDNKLYILGSFSLVGGVARNGLASIDATTGIISNWNPNTDIGAISGLKTLNDKTVIFGSFNNMGNAIRNNIALVNNIDGNSINGWNPNPNNVVNCVEAFQDKLYIGGNFKQIGSTLRDYLACLDLNTGQVVSSWNPTVDGPVGQFFKSRNRLFLTGYFKKINGVDRNGLGLFGLPSGNLENFDPFQGSQGPNGKVGLSVYCDIALITFPRSNGQSAQIYDLNTSNPLSGLPLYSDEVVFGQSLVYKDKIYLSGGHEFDFRGLTVFDIVDNCLLSSLPTIKFEPENDLDLLVNVNPISVSNPIDITISSSQHIGVAEINVIALSGEVILKEKHFIDGLNGNVALNPKNLKSGIYILKVSSKGLVSSQKLIVI